MVFLLFILASAISLTLAVECPSHLPGDMHTVTSGSYCYGFQFVERKDYEDAQNACIYSGGHLAMPKSDDEQRKLESEIQSWGISEPVWIGLKYSRLRGDFYWDNGDAFDSHSDYDNFGANQGTYGGLLPDLEDCVAINPDDNYRWHDYQCSSRLVISKAHYFVCQYGAVDSSGAATDAPYEYNTFQWVEDDETTTLPPYFFG